MQLFIRHTKGLGNSAVAARVRNVAGQYWDFVTLSWSVTETAQCIQHMVETTDSDPDESTYTVSIVAPTVAQAPIGIVQIFTSATGSVLAQESLANLRATDAINKLSFDGSDQLMVSTATNASIVIPAMTGAVYSPTVVFGQKVSVVEGDTPTLSFALNDDYSGWTVDLTMSIESPVVSKTTVPCAWVNAALGTLSVDLSSAQTSIVGQYDCSVKVRNGVKTLTALRFSLFVVSDK